MATTKKSVSANHNSKKGVLADIVTKMETAFEELKQELGEKKFGKRLKKAAKILIHGVDVDTQHKKKGTKKPAKKSVAVPIIKSGDADNKKASKPKDKKAAKAKKDIAIKAGIEKPVKKVAKKK